MKMKEIYVCHFSLLCFPSICHSSERWNLGGSYLLKAKYITMLLSENNIN